jgi:uncharacterized protein (UPF0548 family)
MSLEPSHVLGAIATRLPRADELDALFDRLSETTHSYPEVGATRGEIPKGYNVDRYSAILGRGDAVFESAKKAIRDWVPFHLPWIRVFPQGEPQPGVMVAVAARLVGVWWTNVSRVIYTIDEPDRFGFAYGTLSFHAETGEELFLVQRSRESAEVNYRILAFSKPRHALARLGYPLSRAAQRRFGAGSIQAMRKAMTRPDA